MNCFNCGNEADMEVLMLINGKMQKVSLCNDCYQEKMQELMNNIKGMGPGFDPEQIQKSMFEFMQDNKPMFDKIFSEALDDEGFDINNLDPSNFNVEVFQNGEMDPKLQDKIKESLGNIFNQGGDNRKSEVFEEKNVKSNNKLSYDKYNELNRLKSTVYKKKNQLRDFVAKEEYLQAAALRDEIREMNKKIMIILELEKEYEKQ